MLGDDARIDHIGSTAVPGLAAKPIIDLDVVVPSEASVPAVIGQLESLGYRWRGDLGVAGRQAFAPPDDADLPSHHLYLVVEDNRAHQDHWLLRDLLREDPASRERYATVKRANAESANRNIDLYVEAKAELVAELLTRRARRGDSPRSSTGGRTPELEVGTTPLRATGSATSKASNETPKITVLVAPGPDGFEPGAGERRGEQLVLFAAELDEQPTAWPQDPSGPGHHAADDVETVSTTVERTSRLVALHVAGESPELVCRHIGCDRGHDAECGGRERVGEVADHDGDTVPTSALRGRPIDLHAHDVRSGHGCEQVRRDGARTRAEVRGRAALGGQQLGGAPCQLLALAPRDVDARIDSELVTDELLEPGDPGQWLSLLTPRDPRLGGLVVPGQCEKITRLLLGGDATGCGQATGDGCGRERRGHDHSLFGASGPRDTRLDLA